MNQPKAAVDLAFRRFGNGPPVIILHGLLGSSRNWQALGKALAHERTVYLVDARNHGASPWSDEMTYAAMASDFVQLLDQLGLESAHLVGHSMGGKAFMAASLLHPERVKGLVVVDIAPVPYQHAIFGHFIEAMLRLDLDNMTSRSEIDAGLKPSIKEPAIRAFLVQNAERGEYGMVWKPNLKTLLDRLDDITGWPGDLADRRFEGSTLFLAGGNSDYVTSHSLDVARKLFPGLTHEVIEGAGHWVHAEAPHNVLAHLRNALSS